MALVVPLLLVTILLCPLSPEAQEYYVTPTPPPNLDCPLDQPCHTLSYYDSNTSSLFNNKDNVSLLFLDGVHSLSTYLVISRVQSPTIAGVNESLDDGNPRASVQFHLLQVIDVSVLTVENINLQQSNLTTSNVKRFISQTAVYEESTISIIAAMEISINNTMFLTGTYFNAFNHSTTMQIANIVSLGALLGFTLFTNNTKISIANCIFGDENGLVITINRDSNITILDSTISNNTVGFVLIYQNNEQNLDLKIGNQVAFLMHQTLLEAL